MTVVSQKFPGTWNQKENWYGTEYTYEKIPADFLQEIRSAAKSTSKTRLADLHLPHVNQFIPTKLEVEKKDIKEPALAPKLIRNDELVRTWFKKDDQWSCLYCGLPYESPSVQSSPASPAGVA